ncbi:MAG: protein yceI precursor [Candidatus Solibacter sp.]|nr:protein yceI precursor [Candidatus Solibacter sp.]
MKHLILAAAAVLPAFAQSYTIDSAHSSAQFSVRHLMVSNVKGEFNKMAGAITWNEADPAAVSIDATIDVNTISTREPKRDEHLRSADFFDAAKYPSITFKSAKAWKSGSKWMVAGNLTLHGVTKPVTLTLDGPTAEMKDPWGMLRRGATATTTINRKDFGLGWNKALETGGVMVGEDVQITLDIAATRKPAATN